MVTKPLRKYVDWTLDPPKKWELLVRMEKEPKFSAAVTGCQATLYWFGFVADYPMSAFPTADSGELPDAGAIAEELSRRPKFSAYIDRRWYDRIENHLMEREVGRMSR